MFVNFHVCEPIFKFLSPLRDETNIVYFRKQLILKCVKIPHARLTRYFDSCQNTCKNVHIFHVHDLISEILSLLTSKSHELLCGVPRPTGYTFDSCQNAYKNLDIFRACDLISQILSLVPSKTHKPLCGMPRPTRYINCQISSTFTIRFQKFLHDSLRKLPH